ncbi:MAG: PAS domain S-box protein [Planctomycetes bacterium]|nr:PAS domain S-box protein [Planctomycetota bacterium]
MFGANLLAVGFCLMLRSWMRRGWVGLASVGLLVMGLVLISATVANLGTIRAPATAMYLLLVITGGLLFDLRGMAVTTALCSVLVGALIGAENAGLLPRPDYSVTITQWVAYTAIFVWTGSLAFSALDATRRALRRADGEIAERKKAEEALGRANEEMRRTRDALQDVIDASPAGVVVADAGGQIIMANSRTNELLGGRVTGDAFGPRGAYQLCRPDGSPFPQGDLPLVRAIQRNESTRGLEILVKGDDGSELVMVASGSPLRDADGHTWGAMAVMQDITEGKRAEAALAKITREWQATFDAVGDVVWLLDKQQRIVRANQATERVFGRKPGDIVGLRCCEVIHGTAQPLPECPIVRMEKSLQRESVELPIGQHWYGVTVDPILGEDRNLVGVVHVARDITDGKQAEAERERLLKDVLAGRQRLQSLSRRLLDVREDEDRHIARELHDEIGQLITALKLTLGVFERQPVEQAKARVPEAQALVDDLMTRVRNLSLALRPGVLDDLGLLPALLWHFERYTARTEVQVDFKHTGLERRFAPEVETAAYRIVQEALTNVARHAKASEVTVRLSADAATLGIQVEDAGAGFDADAALASGFTSGLAGMRERAALLGGRFALDSAPGKGTRLVAELPVR